jgi:hypothetical protein
VTFGDCSSASSLIWTAEEYRNGTTLIVKASKAGLSDFQVSYTPRTALPGLSIRACDRVLDTGEDLATAIDSPATTVCLKKDAQFTTQVRFYFEQQSLLGAASGPATISTANEDSIYVADGSGLVLANVRIVTRGIAINFGRAPSSEPSRLHSLEIHRSASGSRRPAFYCETFSGGAVRVEGMHIVSDDAQPAIGQSTGDSTCSLELADLTIDQNGEAPAVLQLGGSFSLTRAKITTSHTQSAALSTRGGNLVVNDTQINSPGIGISLDTATAQLSRTRIDPAPH